MTVLGGGGLFMYLSFCSFSIFEHPDAQVLCSAYWNILTHLWPYLGEWGNDLGDAGELPKM